MRTIALGKLWTPIKKQQKLMETKIQGIGTTLPTMPYPLVQRSMGPGDPFRGISLQRDRESQRNPIMSHHHKLLYTLLLRMPTVFTNIEPS